jgi:membrane protein DedA with SNARE-associated domain
MKNIFHTMKMMAPKMLLWSVVFTVLTYISFAAFDVNDHIPEWLSLVWYVLIFVAVYLAMFSLVVIIVDRLIRLKGDRP